MAAPPSIPDAPGFALDERLCLALYTASRAMTARYRSLLAPLNLTYPQFLVVVVLLEDGASSVGRIGERLALDSSTLSPLIKRLEATGLVTRTRHPRDERSVEVALTGAGLALREQAAAVHDGICAATGLSPERAAELVADLRALTAHLDEGPLDP